MEVGAFQLDPPDLPVPRRETPAQLIAEALAGRVAPAQAPPGRPRKDARYYVGRRPRDTEVYVVASTDVDRLAHPHYCGDAAFDWGKATPGALELAFALLAHTTASHPPNRICLIFQAQVVARLDRAGFVLGDGDIALWLLTAFGDLDGPDERPS